MSGTGSDQEEAKKFLLAEYEHLADSFWRNEENGEKRVNFFVTFATAVMAALVTLSTASTVDKAHVTLVAIWSLSSLLIIGIVTLKRMLRRNKVTDEYKVAMDVIRDYFRSWDDRIREYRPFERGSRGKERRFGTGGLVDMVALMNCIIMATICGAMVLQCSWHVVAAAGIAGFLLAWIIQIKYVRHQYEAGHKGK